MSNIESKMNSITSRLKKMSSNYDAEGFVNQLDLWVKELDFFYSTLVPKQGKQDASRTFYSIRPPSVRPTEGQVAYFNLRRGYPKELFDGHYCYVVKDFGSKYLIVPATSVKDDSEPNPQFEYDINIKNFINDKQTRLQITDMRVVDIQRMNESKGKFDVKDSRNDIVEAIQKVIF